MYQLKTVDVHIRGISPAMQKNGQTANPLNPHAKAVAEISGRKKKSDADRIELAKREFLASLYIQDGRIGWPGQNLEAMIRRAAQKSREGMKVQASLFVQDFVPLIYDGPKDPLKLWEQPDKYVDIRNCGINGKSVARCRPIFPAWECKFSIEFDEEYINPADLQRWLEVAGRLIGLSDYRPKYGRFVMASFKVRAAAA